jgi:hypothetical protein
MEFSVRMTDAELNQWLLENDDDHPDYWEAEREADRRAEYYRLQQWDNAPEMDFPLSYMS